MFNYEALTDQLRAFLTEKYPGVSFTKTDIFEHGLLSFFSYPLVPEKCQFVCDRTHLVIVLSSPYQVTRNDFIRDLQSLVTNRFADILIETVEIMDRDSNPAQFCVRLEIPYTWLEIHIGEILENINSILSDQNKRNFYHYWNNHAERFIFGLMMSIEDLCNEIVVEYPYANLVDIWSALIKKSTGISKDLELKFLEKKVAITFQTFPEISITYQINAKEEKIVLMRDHVVDVLSKPYSLNDFLSYDEVQKEFFTPLGISDLKKAYKNISIYFNKQGNYVINLGCSITDLTLLKKFGIKTELSPEEPGELVEKSRYYTFDRENYMKVFIALKELKGIPCFDERSHQMIYYIHNHLWEKLKQALSFLLNFEAETNIKIDYRPLTVDLYGFAEHYLKGEVQQQTFSILVAGFEKRIIQDQVHSASQKEIEQQMHTILSEEYLKKLNSKLSIDSESLKEWQEKFFKHTQQAGFSKSNRMIAERAGLNRDEFFANDVIHNPLGLTWELANELKVANDKVNHLTKELAQLKKENFLQADSATSANTNRTPFFSNSI